MDGSDASGVPVIIQISIGVGSLLLAGIHDILPMLDMGIGIAAKLMSLIGSISLLLINREKIWGSIKKMFLKKSKS